MGPVVQRIVFSVCVVLAIFFVATARVSDDPTRSPDRTPPLWEVAEHPDTPVVRPSEGRIVSAIHYPGPAVNCPMIVSLDRESPYRFTSVEDGVQFDIDGDGQMEQVSWPGAGSGVAFLAMDRDGDGRISSGRELVGDHTLAGANSGPKALSALAERAAGGERRPMLDSSNPLFSRLSLWTDANHNGMSEPGELRPVGQVLSGIGLGYGRHHRKDRHGNESRYRSFVHVRTTPGVNSVTTRDDISRTRPLYDACLASAQ